MTEGAETAKGAAARHAVERFVRPGLRLALGTGTTAAHAVRALVARFPKTPFDCVASSRATEQLATSLGLTVRPLAGHDRFDLLLDGADEVAPDLALTKGGGGALLREKLLARLSTQRVILVDPSKIVKALGERAPIPVEVVPFARPVVEATLRDAGHRVSLRNDGAGQPFSTDNGNAILDVRPSKPLHDPRRFHEEVRGLIGVVETGVFVDLADVVVVGEPDGRVREETARKATGSSAATPRS